MKAFRYVICGILLFMMVGEIGLLTAADDTPTIITDLIVTGILALLAWAAWPRHKHNETQQNQTHM